MTAIVFPGQGSQKVGMGKDLADALPTVRMVFEEVDEALNQHHYNTYTRANAGDRVDGDYLESPKFFSNFMAQKNYEHFVKNLLATAPINLEYFLNMDLQQGSGGKEIIHNDKTLKKALRAILWMPLKL